MNLYIDKRNFESFLSAQTSEDKKEVFTQCNRMLKKHLTVHLNMNIEDFRLSHACMAWANNFLDGHGSKNGFYFDKAECATNLSEQWNTEQLSSIYLLDNAEIDMLQKEGNVIASGVGGEIDILKKLQVGFDDDQLYTRQLRIKRDFQNRWDGLDDTTLPCSDIVIIDAYILTNPTLYITNLFALLRKLADKVCNTSLNIVIICLQETINNKTKTLQKPCFDEVRRQIKEFFIKEKHVNAKVSFVAAQSQYDFEEHDRSILTNYLLCNSGPSLNFYNSKGELTTNGRYFTTCSLAMIQHEETAHELLYDMQKLIDDIDIGKKNGVILPDGEYPSNLLKF